MVTYLSDDWVRSLDEALRGAAPAVAASAAAATVEFVVHGGPQGTRAWHLTVGPTGARAVAGRASAPTVTFTQPWPTALTVARGGRGVREALLAGDVRVSGDPTRLLPWRTTVEAVQASVARLNADTAFPSRPDEPAGPMGAATEHPTGGDGAGRGD